MSFWQIAVSILKMISLSLFLTSFSETMSHEQPYQNYIASALPSHFEPPKA